jgi:hypothetical protein
VIAPKPLRRNSGKTATNMCRYSKIQTDPLPCVDVGRPADLLCFLIMGLHDCLCGVRDLDDNRLHPGATALARPSHPRIGHVHRAVLELKNGAVDPRSSSEDLNLPERRVRPLTLFSDLRLALLASNAVCRRFRATAPPGVDGLDAVMRFLGASRLKLTGRIQPWLRFAKSLQDSGLRRARSH